MCLKDKGLLVLAKIVPDRENVASKYIQDTHGKSIVFLQAII